MPHEKSDYLRGEVYFGLLNLLSASSLMRVMQLEQKSCTADKQNLIRSSIGCVCLIFEFIHHGRPQGRSPAVLNGQRGPIQDIQVCQSVFFFLPILKKVALTNTLFHDTTRWSSLGQRPGGRVLTMLTCLASLWWQPQTSPPKTWSFWRRMIGWPTQGTEFWCTCNKTRSRNS